MYYSNYLYYKIDYCSFQNSHMNLQNYLHSHYNNRHNNHHYIPIHIFQYIIKNNKKKEKPREITLGLSSFSFYYTRFPVIQNSFRPSISRPKQISKTLLAFSASSIVKRMIVLVFGFKR